MDAESLARRSLQADGAFCITTGTAVLVARKTAARGLRLPVPIVVAAGAATTLWGGGLFVASTQPDWRPATAAVAGVNAVAADGLALLAITRGNGSPRAGTMVLAGAVGTFALVQGYAWLRGRGSADQRGSTDEAPEESSMTSAGGPS